MAQSRIVLSLDAERDLDSLFDWIAEDSGVDRAEAILRRIDETLQLIATMPRVGRVRTDLDGKTVRLPGYVVPMEFKGAAMVAFLLVPFVGACIHVPPPPANQIVYVTSAKGAPMDGLFQAVTVTGTLTATGRDTDLGMVGYQIRADEVKALH